MNQSKELTPISTIIICMKTFLLYVKLSEGFSFNRASWFGLLQMIHDSDHFINNFLEQCPSGRYRHTKYRSSWGRDSFLRSMSIKLNEFL